jgi:hypothetical protein
MVQHQLKPKIKCFGSKLNYFKQLNWWRDAHQSVKRENWIKGKGEIAVRAENQPKIIQLHYFKHFKLPMGKYCQ